MSREAHVRNCGGLEVRFLRSTRRESRDIGSWQVRIREMSLDEPLIKCRNTQDGVKTGGFA
jgi:hypothetical protein